MRNSLLILFCCLLGGTFVRADNKSEEISPDNTGPSVDFYSNEAGELHTLTVTVASKYKFVSGPTLGVNTNANALWSKTGNHVFALASMDGETNVTATVIGAIKPIGEEGGSGEDNVIPFNITMITQYFIITFDKPSEEVEDDSYVVVGPDAETNPGKLDVEVTLLNSTGGPSSGTVTFSAPIGTFPDGPVTIDTNGKAVTELEVTGTSPDKGTITASATNVDITGGQKATGTKDSEEVTLLPIELKDLKGPGDADDVQIRDWDTSQNIKPENIAWIDPHLAANDAPQMPQLEFSVPGMPSGWTIEAKLEVKYERGNGARHPSRTDKNGNKDTVKIPENGDFKTDISGDAWKIWEDYPLSDQGFFGGEATFTCRIKNGTTTILPETVIDFRIGGKNPDDTKCRAYIETLPDAGSSGSLWFAYAIAKSESMDYNGQGSRYNQFLELPAHTQDVGRPLWGNDGGTAPGGYGMFQVTGDASDSTANIPRRQIWNWRENIAGGLAILASKRTTAVAWINQQKNASNANGTALPNHTIGIVTFSEGTARTMTHAVTIKLYNGASRAPTGFVDSGSAPGFRLDPQGSGHYCFWRNASNEWALNRFNDPPDPIQPFNYVARVCGEVEN